LLEGAIAGEYGCWYSPLSDDKYRYRNKKEKKNSDVATMRGLKRQKQQREKAVGDISNNEVRGK